MTQDIVKFKWLFLSVLSVLLFCLPAEAGRLLFWRFESRENQLFFSTDEGVQPEAQLISNPTRLVIDLPGTTLGRPTARQVLGGTISEIRVGQFDQQTTRLVIELAPGYALNPQEIQFRGSSPTQWSVTLPTPERIPESPSQSLPDLPPLGEGGQNQSNSPPDFSPPTEEVSETLQITRSGFFVRLGETQPEEIIMRRSRNRRRIQFDLPGVTLPSNLDTQQITVNRYGVSRVQFTQPSTSPPLARVTLNVSEDSPDWQGSFRIGGLALVPEGGISEVPTVAPISNTPAIIQSVELVAGSTQLLIRGTQPLNGSRVWNAAEGAYQITILNAQLADSFPETSLAAGSPISQMRIRQSDNTVVLLIQPANGIELGELNQPSETSLSLQVQGTVANGTINVPPPQTDSSDSRPRVPDGRLLLVIDPGHGGRDPGAVGINRIQEKDIVLPISLQVAELLEQQGIQVLLTRSDDRFISLDGRVQRANRAGADLFVSIHANAINLSRPDVNGLETYYFSSEGQRFARTIHNRILRSINMGDRGVRRARFYVLRRSSMPSVLVEVGFVTGREDIIRLRDPNERRRMAEAIARGILDYIVQNRL